MDKFISTIKNKINMKTNKNTEVWIRKDNKNTTDIQKTSTIEIEEEPYSLIKPSQSEVINIYQLNNKKSKYDNYNSNINDNNKQNNNTNSIYNDNITIYNKAKNHDNKSSLKKIFNSIDNFKSNSNIKKDSYYDSFVNNKSSSTSLNNSISGLNVNKRISSNYKNNNFYANYLKKKDDNPPNIKKEYNCNKYEANNNYNDLLTEYFDKLEKYKKISQIKKKYNSKKEKYLSINKNIELKQTYLKNLADDSNLLSDKLINKKLEKQIITDNLIKYKNIIITKNIKLLLKLKENIKKETYISNNIDIEINKYEQLYKNNYILEYNEICTKMRLSERNKVLEINNFIKNLINN